jgi:Ca2+-binding EF-hand superfamily protein
MKTKTICLLGLIAVLLPTATQAQAGNKAGGKEGKGPSPEAVFARLDSDENGTLSKNEVRGRMAQNFETIDGNGDGAISVGELTSAREQARQKMKKKGEKVKAADTDGNRAISIDEAADAGMTKLVENFAIVDIDGDGEISRQEMRELRKANKNRKGAAK